jgi:hypothetical protein
LNCEMAPKAKTLDNRVCMKEIADDARQTRMLMSVVSHRLTSVETLVQEQVSLSKLTTPEEVVLFVIGSVVGIAATCVTAAVVWKLVAHEP